MEHNHLTGDELEQVAGGVYPIDEVLKDYQMWRIKRLVTEAKRQGKSINATIFYITGLPEKYNEIFSPGDSKTEREREAVIAYIQMIYGMSDV